MSTDEKSAVIENIQALIESDYVMVDQVERVNDALDDLNAQGRYTDVVTREAFAMALTEDLKKVTGDKHYLVGYRPELIASRKARQAQSDNAEMPGDEGAIDWNYWHARLDNFGIEKVEVLDGNVGYLKITFFQPLEWMRPVIDAAMVFLANTDALIIDVMTNGGGYSPSDSYLGSYFFGREPIVWSTSYSRPTGERSSASTFAEVGATRYLNRPVIILAGKETFSLGEQFAYSLKHFDKARIVGQVTAGAANGISFSFVDDNFVIQIPAHQTINPVTKTNFEGVGVQPDIVSTEDEALGVAHGYALDQIIDLATNDRMIEKYKEIKARITSE